MVGGKGGGRGNGRGGGRGNGGEKKDVDGEESRGTRGGEKEK